MLVGFCLAIFAAALLLVQDSFEPRYANNESHSDPNQTLDVAIENEGLTNFIEDANSKCLATVAELAQTNAEQQRTIAEYQKTIAELTKRTASLLSFSKCTYRQKLLKDGRCEDCPTNERKSEDGLNCVSCPLHTRASEDGRSCVKPTCDFISIAAANGQCQKCPDLTYSAEDKLSCLSAKQTFIETIKREPQFDKYSGTKTSRTKKYWTDQGPLTEAITIGESRVETPLLNLITRSKFGNFYLITRLQALRLEREYVDIEILSAPSSKLSELSKSTKSANLSYKSIYSSLTGYVRAISYEDPYGIK